MVPCRAIIAVRTFNHEDIIETSTAKNLYLFFTIMISYGRFKFSAAALYGVTIR